MYLHPEMRNLIIASGVRKVLNVQTKLYSILSRTIEITQHDCETLSVKQIS